MTSSYTITQNIWSASEQAVKEEVLRSRLLVGWKKYDFIETEFIHKFEMLSVIFFKSQFKSMNRLDTVPKDIQNKEL